MLDDTRGPSRWDGSTYYGREQVKAAPFNNWLVGGYIFLAGLSGGAALISTILDLVRGDAGARVVRRGRLLSLLGPLVGSFGLIVDLHTPKRFYNMLRVFKVTSPMSIGSWILIAFGGCSVLTSAAEMLGLRGMARAAQVPLAATGAGLGTYTASLLSATSTPLWAAAPCGTAVRFAGSSVAAGAAAMALMEGRTRLGRDLDKIALAALTVEFAATLAAHEMIPADRGERGVSHAVRADRDDRRDGAGECRADRTVCAVADGAAAVACAIRACGGARAGGQRDTADFVHGGG